MKKRWVALIIVIVLGFIAFGVKRCSDVLDAPSPSRQQLGTACMNIVRYTGIPIEIDQANLLLYHSTLGGPFGEGNALYCIEIQWDRREAFNQSLQVEDKRWTHQTYSIADSQDLLGEYINLGFSKVTYYYDGEFDWCFLDLQNPHEHGGYGNICIAFYDEDTGIFLLYIWDT